MVKAVETTLRELLEGSKQYQVPLYQRTYSWRRGQFERLWEDLVQLAESRERNGATTHFLGSLVLAPTPDVGPAGVSRYLVVDGQQRLTTLTLLLAALRDHRAETEGQDHRERLNELFLINKWRAGQDRWKLLPTQVDRASYKACLDSSALAGSADGIGEAYRYFRARLVDHDDPEDDYDIAAVEDAALSGLSLVSVTTTHDDNVHRIFESLNNTGLRLSQGDLLRNYLFMRLPTRGQIIYETQWLSLQNRLSPEELELLYWLDAVQTDEAVLQRDVYEAQRRRMDRLPNEEAIEGEVARFNGLAVLLQLILHPDLEQDAVVRERLARLNHWGTTTVYPMLLHLLQRRAEGSSDSAEIARAMLYIESYLVRRILIGKATAGLNRTLLRAVSEIATKAPSDQAVRSYLSKGRKFFATDDQIQSQVRTTALYYSGRAAQRKLLMTWVEGLFGSKEPVDPTECTIEHIMPQTLTPAWRSMILEQVQDGEALADVYDALLHTLGNLTITGYNSSLSNKPFATKRKAYAASGFRMNQVIAKADRWGRDEIIARADDLASRIVEYWPGPDDQADQEPVAQSWGLMDRALAELPAGSWTTYSSVAQLIGSHPVPVGQRIANHPVPNGHRVLQAGGTVSPGFRWLDPRTETQREALEVEGVVFDSGGRAESAQEFDAADLAALAGVELADEELLPQTDDDPGRPDAFLTQLRAAQPVDTVKGVVRVMDDWLALGGYLQYGAAEETTCFLVHQTDTGPIWPAVLYPSGSFQVAFQYLKNRPPFDSRETREELRARMNETDRVAIPSSKIGLRPGFDLGVLAEARSQAVVMDALAWFVTVLGQPSAV